MPITLGTVLTAEGLLGYLGPNGWLNKTLHALGLTDQPLQLVHNYWGVLASLLITGFPFAYLLTLSYLTGIDPSLEQAAATLGAGRWHRFRHITLPLLAPGLAITFCLSFVLAFAVFPSAQLVGDPRGTTHVISIEAYQAAFQKFDYALGSTIAMVMAAVMLAVVAPGTGLAVAAVPRVDERQGLMADVPRGPVGTDGAPTRARPWWRKPGNWAAALVFGFFFVNLAGVIGVPVADSFGTRWFTSWLPEGWTTRWYGEAWQEFSLGQVFWTTALVSLLVVSVLLGVPAAYALARRDFPGRKVVLLLFLLPILVPPLTYGIPLATVLYKFQLAGTLTGVVLANLVPSVPFVVLTMTPFIEQIDPRIEAAARMCGARTPSVLLRVLAPLLVPGILAASVLVLVRTVGMFELTFLTAGPDSQTLVVALYYAVFSAGIRTQQSIDAMAVMYTLSMLVLLVVALRFVNPTQLVTRVREERSQD
ncbi:ABC transporter permease [Streptomyces triticisoli]|uniref:ABC transporter permease n=1 Tax=Streptomyces triticisoli TaxID=2182797 RepID=UPI001E3D792F|nr:ABC transporter permease subunit [Streptomyces triticisoli]